MELQDTATKDYIFQTDPNLATRGILTCRNCKQGVVIEVKTSSFIIFASSKVKVYGKWCNCSNIERIIRSLIGESIGIEKKLESTRK